MLDTVHGHVAVGWLIVEDIFTVLVLLPEGGTSILVACALISITLNPLLFRAIDPVERGLNKWAWLRRLLNRHAERPGRAANRKTKEMPKSA